MNLLIRQTVDHTIFRMLRLVDGLDVFSPGGDFGELEILLRTPEGKIRINDPKQKELCYVFQDEK